MVSKPHTVKFIKFMCLKIHKRYIIEPVSNSQSRDRVKFTSEIKWLLSTGQLTINVNTCDLKILTVNGKCLIYGGDH